MNETHKLSSILQHTNVHFICYYQDLILNPALQFFYVVFEWYTIRKEVKIKIHVLKQCFVKTKLDKLGILEEMSYI